MNCRDCDKKSHLNVYVQYFVNVSAAALRGEASGEDPDRPRTLGVRLRNIDDSVYKTCDTDKGAPAIPAAPPRSQPRPAVAAHRQTTAVEVLQ